MDTQLAGRVVLVTGATANIGTGIALAFAKEGAEVVVVGRDDTQGQWVVNKALQAGAAKAHWMRADVTRYEEVEALGGRVMETCGGIDVLVNNVGGNVDVGPFVESSPDEWRADIDLNLTSTLNCSRVFLPSMMSRGWGRIVNIGSMSGVIGDPYLAVYSAAKAGVHGFTKVLAAEVGLSGVTVNAIAPYATKPDDPNDPISAGSRSRPGSGVFATLTPEKAALLKSIFKPGVLPEHRAKASQIGAAAVFLASEAAAFVTGEIVHVDGGRRLA
ncbi:MAG: short-chain dehydrogenase/reductase [Phenylobacterium sp.]|nr:short-chain dehydrogenase/reductase [Phenylobacterium sp.]